MTSNNDKSDNAISTVDNQPQPPFSEKTIRRIYEKASVENDPRKIGRVEVDRFPTAYTNEKREELNKAIWNCNLPVEHPYNGNQYTTLREAFGKLVYDAEFYLGDWEKVKQVVRESPYPTQI